MRQHVIHEVGQSRNVVAVAREDPVGAGGG